MIDEIEGLPDVSFIDDTTLAGIQTKMSQDYSAKYKELTGKTVTLARADPITLLLYACSVILYQGYLYIDRAGKQDLLKYAYGEYLDNLAALKGITRQTASYATVTVRFTLSAVRPNRVVIPAGTRVTDGNGVLYYSTDEYTEIAPGEEYADIICTCQTAGTAGNEPLAGEIDTLVDLLPYIGSVSNIEAPAGGAEVESDDKLRERVYLAPDGYSVAGPIGAYVYWTKSYNTSIGSVNVYSPTPCVVEVRVLLEDGSAPNSAMLAGLLEYLSDETKRPLTDQVYCMAPDFTYFDIDMTYYINSSDMSSATSIQSKVAAAVSEYVTWQTSEIGRDIIPSELIRRVMEAGAKRVIVNKPTFTVVKDTCVPRLNSQTVNYGGIEDD